MPTVNAGMNLTFDDTVGIKRDVSDLILTLSPYDVPLLQWMPAPIKPITNTKHEWLEDKLIPTVSTLSHGENSSVTDIRVKVGTGAYFRADDVVKVGDELMLVDEVDGDTVKVVARGYGSSSAATHAQHAVITRVGIARPEGSDAIEARATEKTAGYNYTQIFEDSVKVSGTREAILQYGVTSEYAYQLSKAIKERAIQLELALIHGVRVETEATQRRTLGGLLEFVSTNTVDAQGAALTKGVLDEMTHEIWRAGGSPRTFIMNIDQKARLYDIYADRIRKADGPGSLGGFVEYFENDLGRFDIILDRWVPRDMILVIDRDKVGLGPLRGRDWSHTYLGRRGDYMYGHMIWEGTLEVRGEEAHGVISGLDF